MLTALTIRTKPQNMRIKKGEGCAGDIAINIK
jgi:hypothetical protein